MKPSGRLSVRALPAVLAASLLGLPGAAPAGGDYYYYSSGRRWGLVRLENAWAVHAPAGARRTVARDDWGRHGVALVRSSGPLRAAREALGPAARPRFVTPVFDYGAGEPLVMTDACIASFPPSLPAAGIAEVGRRRGAAVVRPVAGPPNTFLLASGEGDALSLANALVESGEAVFAHPNFIARKHLRGVPDDPYFPLQWHLLNTGQGGALPGQDIDAPAAWDVTRGGPEAVVALIDDGFDLGHEDLQGGAFLPGRDFYDGDDDPSADAENGDWHGTAVAGVAAARGGNAKGVSGVAPGCRVLPVRLVAGPTSDEQDAAAIRWAAEHGAWIISNSWGPPDGNPLLPGDERVHPLPDIVRSAIDYAADEGRGGKGCVIFWAAGNGNEPVGDDGYASHEKVIAVGACDDLGVRAYYSDYGPGLDLCAPSDGGVTPGIWTTDHTGEGGYNPMNPSLGDAEGHYASVFGGTSAAAPAAAGVAALILSREPGLTREEVTARLLSTADRADPRGGGYGLDGHSDLYGAGRVNACSALTGRTRHPGLSLAAGSPSLRAGDVPSLRFSVREGRDEAQNLGEAYLVVVPPAGGGLFVGAGYRLSGTRTPFAAAARAADIEGALGPVAPLPPLVPGRYTVYAALVEPGGDPLAPGSWLHTPASAAFDFLP